MIAFLVGLLAFLATPLAAEEAASPILSVETAEPRGFGYFVGDLLRRDIEVRVAKPFALEGATQPKPGRLSYWLDLRSVDVSSHDRGEIRVYRLELVYQTFYVPLSPDERHLPALKLRFVDGDKTAIANVPPIGFVMAPLREVIPKKPAEGPAGYLKPDALPRWITTSASRTGFSVGAGLTLLALALLAHHEAWWPFHKRQGRPFGQAARVLRRLARAPSEEAYREGLRDLHRAFDESAGHRLLAEDVGGYLDRHVAFRPHGPEIGRFFAASRQAFFANDLKGAETAMPLPSVAALSAQLSAIERRGV